MPVEPELVLRGVFTHLVEHGFRLGVRDYLDALRALRAGYGGYARGELLWLCQTLWARTEVEVRAISLLFDELPLPTAVEVAALTGTEQPAERPEGARRSPEKRRSLSPGAAGAEQISEVRVSFAASAQAGFGLPRAQVASTPAELFILTPRPVVPLRTLVIAWRRFRTALRTGPRVELDLEATVAAKCRTGVLDEPALISARYNQARVVVLVDASASMQPWQGLNEVLDASLRQGQLGGWAVLYFDNVPDVLYRDERLQHCEPLERMLRSHARSTLLVVSDAGAARSTRSRNRVRATERFLSVVHPHWRPVAWVNPMPCVRWKGTSAEWISRLRNVSMFELTEAGLIEAVDVLRGRVAC